MTYLVRYSKSKAERMREWREKNPEKSKAIEKRRYLKFKAALRKGEDWAVKRYKIQRECSKRYYQRHRDKERRRGREYYYSNLEKNRERGRNWYRQHKEYCLKKWNEWYDKNRDHRNKLKQVYYNLRRTAKGSFTPEEWENLKKEYNYTCPMCGKKEPEIKLTIDHIIPISKGGTNDISNIQPLCKSCNSKKNNKTNIKLCPTAQITLNQ